jgi:hypothetical protein
MRSGGRKTSRSGTEELGLRDDVGKGNGIITTIKSVNGSPYDASNDEAGHGNKIRKCSVVKALRWDQGASATYLKDDSDEEILARQTKMTNVSVWSGVRKTTTVTSSQELTPGKPGILLGNGIYSRFG